MIDQGNTEAYINERLRERVGDIHDKSRKHYLRHTSMIGQGNINVYVTGHGCMP